MSKRCWCGRDLFERAELPNRRRGEDFDYMHDGQRFHASVRYVSDTSLLPVEVFVNSSKVDSFADFTMRDAAIIMSVALQYGVPLAALGHALGRNQDGSASSPIGALLDILTGERTNATQA